MQLFSVRHRIVLMPTVDQVAKVLEDFAPPQLSEEWDNVGLLVGRRERTVQRLMTCLTVTPESAAEAIQRGANMIVTHHPLPFRPLTRLTSDSTAGRLLLDLIAAEVAIYSPHTAFDSARAGINQHLAIGLGLEQIRPLVNPPTTDDQDVGTGRYGDVGASLSLRELADRAKGFLSLQQLRVVGSSEQTTRRVAVACGSGGSLFAAAMKCGCDSLVTGEASFHTCLDARANGVGLLLCGHFASERFALLSLADYLGEHLPDVDVWASQEETDPINSW